MSATRPTVSEDLQPAIDGEEDIDCPVEGCSYSGPQRSVEAHISCLTDEGHKGETGSSLRPLFGTGETKAINDATDGSTKNDTLSSTAGTYQKQRNHAEDEKVAAVVDATSSGGSDSNAAAGGIPISVLVWGAVVVVLVALVYWISASRSSSAVSEPATQETKDSEDDNQSGVDLIE